MRPTVLRCQMVRCTPQPYARRLTKDSRRRARHVAAHQSHSRTSARGRPLASHTGVAVTDGGSHSMWYSEGRGTVASWSLGFAFIIIVRVPRGPMAPDVDLRFAPHALRPGLIPPSGTTAGHRSPHDSPEPTPRLCPLRSRRSHEAYSVRLSVCILSML